MPVLHAHDALFKAAFGAPAHAARLCRALLPPALVAALDWRASTSEPTAVLDLRLSERRCDVLWRTRLVDGGPIYVLLEHQSTRERDMPLRIEGYLARIWAGHRRGDRHGPLPPVIPIVVSHAERGWRAPRSFWEQFSPSPDCIPGLAPFVPNFQLLIDDLTQVDDASLRGRSLPLFQTLALWLLRDARGPGRVLGGIDEWNAWVRRLRGTAAHQLAGGDIEQLLRYAYTVMGEGEGSEFHRKLAAFHPASAEMSLTFEQQAINRGRQQGLEEGRVAGHIQGRIDLLKAQLSTRFGALPQPLRERLDQADDLQLTRWGLRLVTATSLEEVFQDG